MHKLIAITGLALLTGAFAACGGDDDTNPTPGGLTVEEMAAKTLDIRCTNGVDCHFYESEAECRATSRAQSAQYNASIDAGRIIFHPEKAQACLDALDTVLGCSITNVFGAAATAAEKACTEAFEPTVADGAACYSSTECISQNCEIPLDCGMACCEGKCVAESQLKIGDPCPNNETCAPGAYCKPDAMGMPTSCAATVAEGQPCDAFEACTLPAFCALDFMTGQGTCVVPAAQGEACDLNATFACDRLDNYCDATTKTCVPSKLIGEACDDASFCVFDATCTNGKCEKKPGEGGTCDPMGFVQCLGDLQCEMDGTCQFAVENACK
jgi:hypothetical protein